MSSSKPTISPKAGGVTTTPAAHAAARSKISRYITVLTIFSAVSNRDASDQSIDWESFPFKAEYSELREAGFITGDIGFPCAPGGARSGPAEIFKCGITAAGAMKLAELSEYLWKSSVLGRIVLSLVQAGWLVVGVLIGALGTYLTSLSISK